MDNSSKPLDIKYHTLFSKCFVENCLIEDDDITEIERDTLLNLDSAEIFENFKDLLEQLLRFKKTILTDDKESLEFQTQRKENIIQSLESEVRNQIAKELSLKLELDQFQSKITGFEKRSTELAEVLQWQNREIARQNRVIQGINGGNRVKFDFRKNSEVYGNTNLWNKGRQNGLAKIKDDRLLKRSASTDFNINQVYGEYQTFKVDNAGRSVAKGKMIYHPSKISIKVDRTHKPIKFSTLSKSKHTKALSGTLPALKNK